MYLDRASILDTPPFQLPNEPQANPGPKLASVITLATDRAIARAKGVGRGGR
jgi:hypothetical protein